LCLGDFDNFQALRHYTKTNFSFEVTDRNVPMTQPKHWGLGAKLSLVGLPFMLLAFVSITLTLWVSWQLEGGAAAVNEAGRMRMQAYRMSLSGRHGERR
jgi:hypothetical protein